VRAIAIRIVVSVFAAVICAREAWRSDVAAEAERAFQRRLSDRDPNWWRDHGRHEWGYRP
jgi:hypothetical protein